MAETQTDIQVAKKTAKQLGFRYMDYDDLANIPVTEELLTLDDIERLHIIPIKKTPYKLIYAMSVKTPKSGVQEIQKKHPAENIQIVVVTENTYQRLYQKFIDKFRPTEDPLADLAKPLKEVPNRALLDFILHKATAMNASDVHIEPGDPGKVRFRVDGVLQTVGELSATKLNALTGDVRVRANMLGGAHSQTGHISTEVERDGTTTQVNARVESVKALHGFDYVIRLFTFDEEYLNVDRLGFREEDKQKILSALKSNDQMIMVTGPTGSGKSTTLYSLLNRLRDESVKILTLEDPVEYELPGITQIQVDTDKGEVFSERLRSILREDPDILMIGEVRDSDSLQTALQSAQTGHLILTTYHAASAPTALRRLLNEIDNSSLVASSLKMVMAQRLVRKLCEHCKQEADPSEEQEAEIRKQLTPVNSRLDVDLEDIKIYVSEGCEECYGLGYKGRMMIYELLMIDEALERAILGNKQLIEADIKEIAQDQGMVTLLQDGLVKVINGQTSYEEVINSVG